MNPLITVIIPVFNVQKFVKEAILSIMNQTYKNLEIIIIDDCSTDKTYSIVKELEKLDKRIKVYHNETNLKLVDTLNKALGYVKSDYIVRMDGDDISALDRIEKMFNFLNSNPEYVLVGSQVISINEDGEELGVSNLPEKMSSIRKVSPYISPVLHIWMCRTFLYKELNGYRNILGAEDYDFILRTLTKGYNVANLSDKLYKVRVRSGNTVSTIGLKQEISHHYCVSLYKERLRNNGRDSFDSDFLFKKFEECEIEKKDFLDNYRLFKRGFFDVKNGNFIGGYYILKSMILSKYIRGYLKNRIMYRIKMLGENNE